MKRCSYGRYIPYVRIRYKSRAKVLNSASIRNFFCFLKVIICLSCLIAVINRAAGSFHAAVENICEYKAARLVNEYIDYGVLSASDLFEGKSFVSVNYGTDGTVRSVETDGVEVNRFASVLSESIQKEIEARKYEKITVPLGAVTGTVLLSSSGISVPFRIIPEGKVQVTPESVFHDAGINQTIHKLKMNVSVRVKILFPLVNREERIDREIIVSETVIVGRVPEMFLTKE